MRLWDWAVAAYVRPGVEAACLELQDIHGQNTCLLLWAAWAAVHGRPVDEATAEEGSDVARAWDVSAIQPLRTLRRNLKKPIPDMENEAREALRAQVKAVELAAERALLEELEPIAPRPGPASLPIDRALITVARVWGRTTPRVALTSFAAMLSG